MIHITNTQRDLLARAAASDGAVEVEDSKVGKALIKHGLAISLPVEGAASRLLITEAGRAFHGAQGDAPAEPGHAAGGTGSPEAEGIGNEGPLDTAPPPPTARPRAPKGKLGALVELLQRPGGATVSDMMTATGWQAHSVRGAMSGSLKKTFGFTIASEKRDAERFYRIETEV